jgi:hypothetical protein
MTFCGCSKIIVKPGVKVITIEPPADALSVCALKEVQRLGINPFVQAVRGSFVQQIEPAKDAMRTEEVDKLFCTVFKQFCALKVVDKLAVDSLTHELTTAEVTAVFRGQGLSRAAYPEPQPGVHL